MSLSFSAPRRRLQQLLSPPLPAHKNPSSSRIKMAVQRRKPAEVDASGAADALAASATAEPKTTSFDRGVGHLGVTLSNMSGVGVLVEKAEPSDLCAKAGLVAGTVIVAVDGKSVMSHEEAMPLLDNAVGKCEVAYLTPEAAAAEAEAMRLKYDAKWAWFNWKPKLVLVLLVLAMGYFSAPHAMEFLKTKAAELEKAKAAHGKKGPGDVTMPKMNVNDLMGMGKQEEPDEPEPIKYDPITDPFTLALEKDKFYKEYDQMCEGFMMGAMFGCHDEGNLGQLKKAVNENKRDPREGVDILKHMMGEFEMLKDMQASGTFDPPGFDSKDLPDIDV